MLRRLAVCSSIEGFLLLILFHCIACDCPFPKKDLPNGRFVFKRSSDVNETIAKELYVLRFKCYTGYQRIGPRYIQCIDDQWTDVVPTCAKMECVDAPVVENARYKIHSGVNNFPTLGSFVVYSCKTGFQLNNTNASTLHCVLDPKANNARWKGEIPVCVEKESCPDPGVSKHGSRKGDCCFSGDVLQFSCEEDYELVGNSEIKCLEGGGWSSGRPLCKPEEDHCEVPPVIPHGVVTGDKDGDYFRPYDEAEILCKPGYRYNGPSRFIVCEEEGVWEDEFGECIEISCDAPEPLANGTIPELLTTNQTSFPYGFAITYLCDNGYRLLGGDSWRTCGKDGWSGKTPHCEPVFCPDPGVPENGDRSGGTFHVGAKVRFKCFTGYELIGSLERYCKPNGQWTGELSRCDTPGNYCPNPGIPIKGYKNSTSYDMGDKVGFHCHSGYIRIGSEVRECLPNRTWSGSEAFCLGPYDFDNSAEVRDALKAQLAAKAEEQEKELKRYLDAVRSSWHNGTVPVGRILDINYPGRLILYFAFDVSGSVGLHNFEKSIEFAKAIVKRVGISENGARAGALTFSSRAENMFLPLSYSTTEDVLHALDRINYTGGGTAAASALSLVREENIPLVEGVLGKKNIKSVIFIITDGKANMGGSPEVEAEALKNAGVEIYCIGITGSIEKESLYKIASTSTGSQGEYENVYILQNYATMSWLVQEITNGTVDYSQCGLGMENVGVVQRGKIVGGKTSVEPWPWMAALYMPLGKSGIPNTLQCGASIIHRNFILTAAHCMYDEKLNLRNKGELLIKLGLTDVKNETYVQELEVLKIIIHPRYRPGPNYDYDIALLEVEKPIEFNPFVRPICLPPVELPVDSTLYSSEEFGWATGWGHQGEVPKNSMGNERLKSSDVLKELPLPIQTRERCIQSLVNNRVNLEFFSDRMFCAGDGKRGNDTCRGDSGGPLMQSGLNSDGYLFWTQIGIVSWGIGCGQEDTYGYYTHVQKFVPWINSIINSREELI